MTRPAAKRTAARCGADGDEISSIYAGYGFFDEGKNRLLASISVKKMATGQRSTNKRVFAVLMRRRKSRRLHTDTTPTELANFEDDEGHIVGEGAVPRHSHAAEDRLPHCPVCRRDYQRPRRARPCRGLERASVARDFATLARARSRAFHVRWDRVKLMEIPRAFGLNGRFVVHPLERARPLGTKPAR
jgi:hypothetical protein